MSLADCDNRILLPDEVIIAYGNHLLEQEGRKERISAIRSREHNYFVLDGIGPKGHAIRLVAPLCQFRQGYIAFRSILRVVDTKRDATWLLNGQSSKNTKELIFRGEQGPALVASKDAFEAWVRSGIENDAPLETRNWCERIIADGLRSGLYGEEFELMNYGNERIPLVQPGGGVPTP